MKKNLFLSIILFALIFITFFIEERSQVESFERSVASSLINPQKIPNLSQINFEKISLIKDKKWLLEKSHYPVSEEYIDSLKNEFSSLKIVDEISYKEEELKNFFQFQDHTFKLIFLDKEITLRLGDVNQVTGYFYILKTSENKTKLYLCKVAKSIERAYQDEIQKRIFQYIEFKNLITESSTLSLRKGLEEMIDWENLNLVSFDPDLYRPFEVKDSGIISPLPPEGVTIIKNTFKDLKELLKKISPLTLIEKENFKLSPTTEIIFKGEEEVHFLLYKSYKGREGFFLEISSYPDYLIELDAKELQFFYLTHQDFWSKKIHFDVDFEKLENIEFDFIFPKEKRTERFVIENFRTFKISSSKGFKINEQSFNLIFNIIFGVDKFKKARLLGELHDLKLKNKDFEIGIKILGRSFTIVVSHKQIFVIDDEKKYYLMYDFDLGELTPRSSKDFFKD